MANVGDAGTYLDDRSITAKSSGETISLTGFLGPGENAYFSLPAGTLNVGGDFVKMVKGGAIFQGYYDGPVAAGHWVQLKWTSETTLATSVPPTPTPTPDGVALSRILPDSTGDDDSTGVGEKIWIINNSDSDVSPVGWQIIGRAENEADQVIKLTGTIASKEGMEFLNESGESIFNNTVADCILLKDGNGIEVNSGTYDMTGIGEDEDTDIVRPCNFSAQ